MFDLKSINAVLGELEEERGISRATMLETIQAALATAYKREYGKRGQIIRADFDIATGTTEFFQVKTVVDESTVRMEEEESEEVPAEGEDEEARPRFDPEKHILLQDARRMKKDAELGDELTFPLEHKDDYGRIAAQTAKQVIIQKIREAERSATLEEYGGREGEIISGTVQRIERGAVFIDLNRATGIMPYEEQIPGERFRQGERVRAYLYRVEESPRGVILRLSRSHPEFLKQLFAHEAPELAAGVIEIIRVAREPGSRAKIAVVTHDEHVDPVGSLVGQRGVRVGVVTSELGGEKIDIIEYSDDPAQFVGDALSPAKALNVEIDAETGVARVDVAEDQQSLAIGRGGQNVRLAAKLTGLKIDIHSAAGEALAEADEHGDVEIVEQPSASPAATTTEDGASTADESATETPAVCPLDESAEKAPAEPDTADAPTEEKALEEETKA